MTPSIKSFRCKDYGLFMDLGSGDTLAVDTATGDVMISHGGVATLISPAQCKGFELSQQSVRRHQVSIRQAGNINQVVGYTLDPLQAKSWIENANAVIAKNQPAIEVPAKIPLVRKAASRAKPRLVSVRTRQIHT